MEAAVEEVLGGCSMRSAAFLKNVTHFTLSRYVKKTKEHSEKNIRYAPNYSVMMISTAEQKEKLKNVLIMCSKMNMAYQQKIANELHMMWQ
ncbi:unnamed protein product [Hermetia illucens]|uniref:Transposase n=1 Tax=Hermetia illucens TaxID=343691 RepID=A0A7R8UL46_HERIL|nr:unnamed protein product [Hermetia illucens]